MGFRAWFTKQEESPPQFFVGSARGPQVSLDRTSTEMLREFVRSIYIWRSVDMIAQMASAVALEVHSEGGQLSPQARQVAALMRKPNPQWTGAALQYFLAASLAITNRAFLKRVGGVANGASTTQELWPLNADEVTIRYANGSKMIEGFELMPRMGQPSQFFPVGEDGQSEIIFIHRPVLNPQADRSPAAIAAPPAETFTRILQRCADIVSNSSNITGLLSTDADILEPALEKMKDKLAQFKLRGTESGGTLLSSNAKWTFTRLNEDPASALSVAIKDSLARDVVMTFGVPSQLVGLPGQDTYNNIAMARVAFLTDTVMPGYIGLYVAALNLALLSSEDAIIRPDISQLPVMVQGRLQMTETAVRATMLSVNEQRALLGYPPHDDPMADVPVMVEDLLRKRLQVEIFGGHMTGGGAAPRPGAPAAPQPPPMMKEIEP